MGNYNGKDSHGPAGSPLDFFHTPPTTPSQAELAAMASADDPPPPSPADSTTSPITDWNQKLPAPSEWALISVNSVTSSEANTTAASHRAAAVGLGSPASLPLSEQSWQERDSGLEPQAAADRVGEEMTLVLLSLMEHYRSSLNLSPHSDVATGAAELLRHLITEREELVGEVDSLRETLRTERLEWHQFQCDLQVAVSVADRLRAESEQALSLLQESHRTVEARLAKALSRQRETQQELESLRLEHRDICRELSELGASPHHWEGQDDTQTDSEERMQEGSQMVEDKDEAEAAQEMEARCSEEDVEEMNGLADMQLKGKGVAEAYLRSLAALEKRKEEGRGQNDPRRTVMTSERSLSLSRLPLPSDSSRQSESTRNISRTLPLCRKEEPSKGRKTERMLLRQDSWSSFYTGKQEENQSTDSAKPQDSFSVLLRRHGGSRRNALLRWCQNRTQDYKNIEITNFSSSWEDGLAFCAVYHSYLPTHIHYEVLNLADKKKNLELAFKTGESIGITATLTPEIILRDEGPDWQRVLGYVESIFRHFEM
ncbi:cytospin-A-like [Gouania willdenowi]|uniref:Cytospin-A n=1 Tax=Gouania willdenowi TaxID=441366 RepID=A0A8C5NA23_GOUWI|nr:cytospin-A-like [Gouania willdenowi]